MSKIRIRIVFSDQLIKFEKFTGRRYELIEIVENVFDSGSIGFFNESGYAIVSKFSYSKK